MTGLHKGQNASKRIASRHHASKRIASRHLLSFVRYALQSKVPMSTITSSMLQYSHSNPIPPDKKWFWWLSKQRCFMLLVMPLYFPMLLTQYTPKTRMKSLTTHSPHFGAKRWNLLFTVTIHCYYSLWIFAYLRGTVPYIRKKCFLCLVQDFFLRESFPLRAFLCEISLLTITSYLLYKACNS